MISGIHIDPLMAEHSPHQEGELFKVIQLWEQSFPIYYGYYEQCDRENPAVDPMPIYPDFLKAPRYTQDGAPFVTQMQDICPHYCGKQSPSRECGDCRYYLQGEELLGICTCIRNRKEIQPTVTMPVFTNNPFEGGSEV